MPHEIERQSVAEFANAVQVLLIPASVSNSSELAIIWMTVGEIVPQVPSGVALRALRSIVVRGICQYERSHTREMSVREVADHIDHVNSATTAPDLRHAIRQYAATWDRSRDAVVEGALIDSRIARALTFIDEHLCDPNLCVDLVADHVGMSRSHFAHLLKRYVDEPYVHRVRRLRLEKACALLRDVSLSVKEISAQAGYSHVSVFDRAFRLGLGLSPSEWRRNGLQRHDSVTRGDA